MKIKTVAVGLALLSSLPALAQDGFYRLQTFEEFRQGASGFNQQRCTNEVLPNGGSRQVCTQTFNQQQWSSGRTERLEQWRPAQWGGWSGWR